MVESGAKPDGGPPARVMPMFSVENPPKTDSEVALVWYFQYVKDYKLDPNVFHWPAFNAAVETVARGAEARGKEGARRALEVAEAALEELEFTYSHPLAAEVGAVWTAVKKVPRLYRALRTYIESREDCP